MRKKLRKSSSDRFLAGVLGGIAQTYHLDSTLVRIIYAAITLFTCFFPGVFLYLIAATVMPSDE